VGRSLTLRRLGGGMTRAATPPTEAAGVGRRLCDAVAPGLAVLPHHAVASESGFTPDERGGSGGLERRAVVGAARDPPQRWSGA
jgi:hypothetical protein